MKDFGRIHISIIQKRWHLIVRFSLMITCSMPFFSYFFMDWNIPYMPDIKQEDMVSYSYEKVMHVIENGDILITFDSHFFNWRNGHASIVIDATNGIVLEAKSLGVNSAFANINRWSTYNSFAILRLAELPLEKRSEIACFAKQKLYDIPYDLLPSFVNFPLEEDAYLSGTHCSHLIWISFMQYGYDLDSDGGIIVTPRDLYDSPYLQKIAVYIVPK